MCWVKHWLSGVTLRDFVALDKEWVWSIDPDLLRGLRQSSQQGWVICIIVKVCLPSAPGPCRKKICPDPVLSADCRGDPLKCSRLILGESCNMLCSKLGQSLSVVLPLFQDQAIPKHLPPVLLNLWHASPLLNPLPSVRKKLVNQVETIVLNLCICGIFHICMALKMISEVITGMQECSHEGW